MRVLVVEDDRRTASFVRNALEEDGFAVDVVHDGIAALAMVQGTPVDVVVMDIVLPEADGLEVLRRLRQRGFRTPVLLLSARGQVNERVEGLQAGADDYLPKPFALAELVARVHSLSRRSADLLPVRLQVEDLSLDPAARVATRGGKRIELTTREFRLLEYLMQSAGRVCTRMMILEKVWDYSFDPGSNIIDVYIRKLRGKIDADFEPKLLHAVRGVGYVIRVEP